jgi:hypothetical protein
MAAASARPRYRVISIPSRKPGMPSRPYPAIDKLSPAETWIYIREIVTRALREPETAEESENLVASLGPQYEEDPQAVDSLLQKVNPQMGLDRLLKENPTFDLEDPPREIVQNVVATLLSLRPDKTTPPR